ncbi:MAG: ArsR/SmtB family transcription factor [Acholeplasmataceae bacterium]
MQELIDFFRAISDGTRLRLLSLLAKQEYCVCELTEIMELSQPKVSKHLSKLRDLGFVGARRKGQFIYYHLSVAEDVIREIIGVLEKHAKNDAILAQDRARIASAKCALDQRGVDRG